MNKYLLIFVLLFCPVAANATSQLGITPCTIAAQPTDLAVTGVSSNKHLSTCGETIIVFNNGTSDIRFRLGTTNATVALLTDLLIPANSFVVLNVGISGLWLAAISAGTSTVSFIQGTANS